MKPFRHTRGGWAVQYSAKNSGTGKRLMRYYATQKDAEADIKKHVGEVQEFGRNAVTAEDRSMILLARQQLGGSLDLLPQVLEHWRKTGAGSIKPTKVEDAVEEFKEWR